MRRMIKTVLLCTFLLTGIVSSAMAVESVVIEGPGDKYPRHLELSVEAYLENEIAWIPLTDIAVALGYQYSWDSESYRVDLLGHGVVLQLQIGNPCLLIDTLLFDMETAPRLEADRTMIPLQLISQAFGCQVEYSDLWNEGGTIYITPYSLIADAELQWIKPSSFERVSPVNDPLVLKLKAGGSTPADIQLGSSIKDVLQVYGVPYGPERALNYDVDWSGVLTYWGTFIPRSDNGSFWELVFEQGNLQELTIYGL